ncbi:MAG: hypothetical protein HQK63_14240 [Desulfamplus sp.]|nr:hypothetical protein [Desulfamplus sp.]
MILQEIKHHKYEKLFKRHGVARCARTLRITTNYLYSILQGVNDASIGLTGDIEELARALQVEEMTQDNIETTDIKTGVDYETI